MPPYTTNVHAYVCLCCSIKTCRMIFIPCSGLLRYDAVEHKMNSDGKINTNVRTVDGNGRVYPNFMA